ncbi:hypothetical protein [Dictyobacter formicarum]|uniref:Uncharacterized protein n=1 Tax=Dictyobacter formicarum TaxID=2778368 RepID=A0ABQ3VMF3_9CHLR|nr:hypothetical protein [Dictyobacter formicarum]GHO87395.1 hypothetical protein KSZ_54010 [Dictyobacter formicarum]
MRPIGAVRRPRFPTTSLAIVCSVSRHFGRGNRRGTLSGRGHGGEGAELAGYGVATLRGLQAGASPAPTVAFPFGQKMNVTHCTQKA